jgi:hypothetical protein
MIIKKKINILKASVIGNQDCWILYRNKNNKVMKFKYKKIK